MAIAKIESVWNGPALEKAIQDKIRRRLDSTAKRLKNEVTKTLTKQPWGSVLREDETILPWDLSKSSKRPSGAYISVDYSSPGSIPFKQTGNLANSFEYDVSVPIRSYPYGLEAVVFTEVPYAATLELGLPNPLQLPMAARPNAERELADVPYHKSITIEPRPFFRVTIERMLPVLKRIIAKGR